MKPFSQRLLPAPLDGGFRQADTWVWCGSVMRDPAGLYHMFASAWAKTVPFSPNWLTNSRVVHAVSTMPAGPYTYRGEVLPPRGAQYWDGLMTHNPTIHRHGDTYLLFYTGSTFDGAVPHDRTPVTPAMRLQARANQRIGVATAKSLDGPWTRSDAPCLDPRPGKWDALMTTNAAPCVLPDGRILLLYKSVASQEGPIQYGVAMAAGLGAPFTRLTDGPLTFGRSEVAYEDAFVWHEDGALQMIFNDMTGAFTGEDHAGAHAWSRDGVTWQLHAQHKAYSRKILWADGSSTTQGSFERPQLLLEDGRPTHLFAATGDGPGGFWRASNTWNMVVPLA
jgi:hypothetical protein